MIQEYVAARNRFRFIGTFRTPGKTQIIREICNSICFDQAEWLVENNTVKLYACLKHIEHINRKIKENKKENDESL